MLTDDLTTNRLTRLPLRRAALAAAGLWIAGTCAGCRALVELVEADTTASDGVDAASAPTGDAGPRDGDAAVDAAAPCDTWTYAPAHFDPCDLPAPGAALTLAAGEWTYDTDSGELVDPLANTAHPPSALLPQPGGPEARIVSLDALEIQAGARLRVLGARPLIVASWSRIQVDGIVDASSSRAEAGAGADAAACLAATAGADNANGAGGGGGGGFGGAGADGGTGENGAGAAGAGGAAAELPTTVRGGCAGATGGNALAGGGGHGGGAVQLTARHEIAIEGTLHAGGAGGGAAGGGRSGGGGGGSGGMLGLQAPAVSVAASAVLAANGGGGGGGCDNNPASPGGDAVPLAVAAAPGDGEGMGRPGGAGGFADTPPDPGGSSARGGGGGGGAVGFILLWADDESIAGAAVATPAITRP